MGQPALYLFVSLHACNVCLFACRHLLVCPHVQVHVTDTLNGFIKAVDCYVHALHQPLLPLQALPGAEAAVGRLLSAVRAAAPCTLEEQQLIQGQAGQLLGDLVSVASRVRSLRDALDTVRGAAGGGGSGRL